MLLINEKTLFEGLFLAEKINFYSQKLLFSIFPFTSLVDVFNFSRYYSDRSLLVTKRSGVK